MQTFIRVSELPRLSYSASDTATITGGDTVEQLEVRLLPHTSLLIAGPVAVAPCPVLQSSMHLDPLLKKGYLHSIDSSLRTAVLVQVELQDARHAHGEQGLVSLVVKDSRPR